MLTADERWLKLYGHCQSKCHRDGCDDSCWRWREMMSIEDKCNKGENHA